MEKLQSDLKYLEYLEDQLECLSIHGKGIGATFNDFSNHYRLLIDLSFITVIIFGLDVCSVHIDQIDEIQFSNDDKSAGIYLKGLS